MKMLFAMADDWMGIYVKDVLISQGRSIDAPAAVGLAISHHVTDVEVRYVDLNWMRDEGSLPMTAGEVKWEKGYDNAP